MIIVDSDIIIEIFRNNKDAIRALIKTIATGETVRSTVINSQEVLFGTEKENETEEFLQQIGVLDYGWHEMKEAVRVKKFLKKKGTFIGEADEMIAGICLANNASILTKNKKHFSKVPGLKVKTW